MLYTQLAENMFGKSNPDTLRLDDAGMQSAVKEFSSGVTFHGLTWFLSVARRW
jgi:hypothetical protein